MLVLNYASYDIDNALSKKSIDIIFVHFNLLMPEFIFFVLFGK